MSKLREAKKFSRNISRKGDKGFTLLEMIVAVALFAVVMLISVGALLSLVAASRKAQALHLVVNNLNITLDSMVRSVRMGRDYHCGVGVYTTAKSCPNSGDETLAFEAFGGDSNDSSDQWVYQYNPTTKRIYKSVDGGLNFLAVTAPTVSIDKMRFYVVGAERDDMIQPKVVVVIQGTAGSENAKTQTSFNIQSTAVQRVLDL